MGYIQNNFATNVFIYLETSYNGTNIKIHIEMYKKNIRINKTSNVFPVVESGKWPTSAIDYIYVFVKKYSYVYFSVIFDDGFFETIVEKEISSKKHRVIEEQNYYMKPHASFRIYCEKIDVDMLKHKYLPFSIDYVFSPYSILYYLVLKNHIKEIGIRANVLIMETSISVIIVKNQTIVASVSQNMKGEIFMDSGQNLSIDIDNQLHDEFAGDHSSLIIEDALNNDKDTARVAEVVVSSIDEVSNNFYESNYYAGDDDLIVSASIYEYQNFTLNDQSYLEENLMLSYGVSHCDVPSVVCEMIRKNIWT